MQINSVNPSFHGYIRLTQKENCNSYNLERTLIFNTNSIAIENIKNSYDLNSKKPWNHQATTILSNGKTYDCMCDIAALEKAIKIADLNPGSIIDVEKSQDINYFG